MKRVMSVYLPRWPLQRLEHDESRLRGTSLALADPRAVELLRASIPVKAIGDLLGHRSAESTEVYLKLATEDLRSIALEVPMAVRL